MELDVHIYLIFMLSLFFFFYNEESSFPANFLIALGHAMLVEEAFNNEADPSVSVEASELYPEVKYTTVDNYLNAFV